MHSRFYLLTFLVIVLIGCDSSNTETGPGWDVVHGDSLLTRVDSIANLATPRSVVAPADTALYFVDWGMNGLHKYDPRRGYLSPGTGIGQGPGEIRDESAYFLSALGDGRIWLHDRQQRRVTLYDADLNPLEEITITGSMRSLPLRDSFLVTVPRVGEHVTDVRTLGQGKDRIEGVNSGKLRTSYPVHASERFGPLAENYALRYGPAAGCGTSVVIGFDFASALLLVHADTIKVLNPPENVPFPIHPDLSEGQARLPNWFNPKGTLDLACNTTHIYSLFSGKKVSRSKIRTLDLTGRLTSSKRAELSARTERSDRLHVYNRETETFTYEIQLPVDARQVAATDTYLYLVRHEPGGPHILKYAWTK